MNPTRTRYWVVFFAVTLAIVTYIHRVCISQAAPDITREFGLTKEQMGFVFAGFAVAYAFFEIPGGWLGDKLGPRKVLTGVVLWWSLFTAATGWAWNLVSLVAARFFFGMGQAAGFPNLTKAFTMWLPTHERVRAQGIMWMSARWGGAFTPPLVIFALGYMHWRVAFGVFALLGIVWAAVFYIWFRDNPGEHHGTNAAELDLIVRGGAHSAGHGDVPWGRMLRSRSVWLLWAQYFAVSYPWYFYITWLPTYLQENRHLTPAESAQMAVFPLFFGGIGCLLSGFIAPLVARLTGSVSLGRRIVACIGFAGASVMLFLSIQMKDPLHAMLLMGMASFCNDITIPPSWGACMDVGGKYAGTLSGSMNMVGNFAGFVAPTTGGFILQATGGDWNTFLYSMAAFYLLGVLMWPFIDPVTPMEKHHSPAGEIGERV